MSENRHDPILHCCELCGERRVPSTFITWYSACPGPLEPRFYCEPCLRAIIASADNIDDFPELRDWSS